MLKKIFFILFLISFSITIKAQYTEVINSNHPGFSESPYSVGIGVYQFETSMFHKQHKANTIFDNPVSTGLNLNFRTSFFFENLELNLKTSVHRDEYTFKNLFLSHTENKFGLGDFTVGAKYLVFAPKYIDKSREIRSWKKRHSFDWNRCIPHAGVYAGFNFGSILEGPYNKGNTAKVGVLLQNEFDLRYNFVTNIYYDNIGSDFSECSYILTSTYLFNQQWSGFVEHQAKFNQFENTSNAGGGLTYLYSEDLQLNSSVRATFQESGLGYHANLGVSYRIDKHADKFIELDEFGNPIDGDSGKKKLGFFGRIFDSVKRLFIRSEEVEIDDIDEDGEPITTTVKIPNKERKRSKSVLKKIVRKDKKNKKKKAKSDKKAFKKEKRAKDKSRAKVENKKRKLEDEKIESLTEVLDEKEDLLKEYQKEKQDSTEGKEDLPNKDTEEPVENTDPEENKEEIPKEEIDLQIEKIKEEIELQKKIIEEEKKLQEERRTKVIEENKKIDEEASKEDSEEKGDEDMNSEDNEEEVEEKKKEKSKRVSSISGIHIDLENKETYNLSFKDINSEENKFVTFSFRGPKTSDFGDMADSIITGFKKAVADETIKFKANGELIGLKYTKQNGTRAVQFVKYNESSREMSRKLTKEEIKSLFQK